MRPCKHLDYSDNYPTCILRSVSGVPGARYWERTVLPYAEAPRNVQFCGAGRGRINGIFQCYSEGEMPCYEPAPEDSPP